MALLAQSSEIAKCHCNGDEVVLVRNGTAIYIQWWSRNETSKPAFTHLVTKEKQNADVCAVQLDHTLYKMLFNINSYNDVAGVALIALESGTLVAVHQNVLKHICYLSEPIVWTGTIEVKDQGLTLIAIGRSGQCVLAARTKNQIISLTWMVTTISLAPLACESIAELLVVSDGVVSQLISFHLSLKNDLTCETKCLPYMGVHKLRCPEGFLGLELETIDGRSYRLSTNQLLEKSKKNSEGGVILPLVGIPNLLDGIVKCGELIKHRGVKLSAADLYIQQLNLAIQLLVQEGNLFDASATLIRVPGGTYQATIKCHLATFKSNLAVLNHTLDAHWWQLDVSVSSKPEVMHCLFSLEHYCTSDFVSVCVPFPRLHTDQDLDGIKINVTLILRDYAAVAPVCRIPSCTVKVDVFQYLVTECVQFKLLVSQGKNFVQFLHQLMKKNMQKQLETVRIPMPPCKASVSCVGADCEKIIKEALALTEFDSSAKCSITLWYENEAIHIDVVPRDNEGFLVSLEGNNPGLVLSARRALDARLSSIGHSMKMVKIPWQAVTQGHMAQQLINLEEENIGDLATVVEMHYKISRLVSLLPW